MSLPIPDLVPRLQQADIFAGIGRPVLERLAAVAQIRDVRRRTQLFHQGDADVRAHLCLEGWVRISQTGTDGHELVLRFIMPGHIFGTVALFTDSHYPADARAITDVIEASWRPADLIRAMETSPAIAINAIRIIGGRLQQTQTRLRHAVAHSAGQRIAQTLLTLGQHSGMAAATRWRIPFPLRRKDIADVAGTTIYTASRTLNGWRKRGIITAERRVITINDRAALEAMVSRPAHG